jgi:hypothetical protein
VRRGQEASAHGVFFGFQAPSSAAQMKAGVNDKVMFGEREKCVNDATNLLELLDGSLVNTTALVDQVTGSGGLM